MLRCECVRRGDFEDVRWCEIHGPSAVADEPEMAMDEPAASSFTDEEAPF